MKKLLVQFKMSFIFLADLLAAFLALVLMIFIRYGGNSFYSELRDHAFPFTVVFFLFILAFYIFNLYSFRFNRNTTEFISSFIKSIIIAFSISVLVFYIFGDFFKLTPKTNLVLFTIFFSAFDFYLRILAKRRFVKHSINRKIVIIGGQPGGLIEELAQNQNIGYKIIKQTAHFDLDEIITINPDVVVIDEEKETELDKIYTLMKRNIFVYTINNFYEEIFQKVPTDQLEKTEIIDYISKNRTLFNFIKRTMDIFLSGILILVLSPIALILAILIKSTSQGPILFKHKRISLNDENFTIYKFRSMYTDAEKNGAVWTKDNNRDPRITPLGRFMRNTHLDEIPQLVNIIRGDISFVGPRPERPEFTGKLKKIISYYDLRHAVKAGLTGWAQVNYKYGSSIEDAKEKLKYDFFYIKNRSIFFDILIILKTLAKIFAR